MLADLSLSASLKFSAVGIDGCRAGWVAAFQLDGEPVLVLVKGLSELTFDFLVDRQDLNLR